MREWRKLKQFLEEVEEDGKLGLAFGSRVTVSTVLQILYKAARLGSALHYKATAGRTRNEVPSAPFLNPS